MTAIPSYPDAKASDPIDENLARRLRSRVPGHLVGYKPISAEEYQREMAKRRRRRRSAIRIIGSAIGLAGCSAATILLPMPVAIWAASAFAALTVSAAVPP